LEIPSWEWLYKRLIIYIVDYQRNLTADYHFLIFPSFRLLPARRRTNAGKGFLAGKRIIARRESKKQYILYIVNYKKS